MGFESLLPRLADAFFHEKIGGMTARISDTGQSLQIFPQTPGAECLQLRIHLLHALPSLRLLEGEQFPQTWVRNINAESEDVNFLSIKVAGYLNSRYQVEVRRQVLALFESDTAIVIGNSQMADLVIPRTLQKILRAVFAVGIMAVAMQIYFHFQHLYRAGW